VAKQIEHELPRSEGSPPARYYLDYREETARSFERPRPNFTQGPSGITAPPAKGQLPPCRQFPFFVGSVLRATGKLNILLLFHSVSAIEHHEHVGWDADVQDIPIAA